MISIEMSIFLEHNFKMTQRPKTPRDRFVTDEELASFCAYAESYDETGKVIAEMARLGSMTG